MTSRRRQAFSLIEVLIAAALGIAVIASGMFVYVQGNKAFQTTTEHASARETAQLILDRLDKDLDQLVVSDQKWPDGTYLMVEPYKLVDVYDQTILDPKTKQPIPYAHAGSGIDFYHYSHTENGPDGRPRIVGKKVHYETKPIDGDPKNGVNLFRNGERVNQTPLSEIIFQKVPPNVSEREVGASPNAIVKVTVVPEGGMWRTMSHDAIEKLKEEGTILARVFHLSGYESQYTADLYVGLSQMKSTGNPESIPNPVVKAVTKDALANGGAPVDSLKEKIAEGIPAQGYVPPPDLVKVDDGLLDEKEEVTYSDPKFANAEEVFTEPTGDAEVPETLHPSGKTPFQNGWGSGQPNHCPAVSSH